MDVRLYLDPKCIFCKFLEPGLRAYFFRRGITLQVFKLRGAVARQVNGSEMELVRDVDATPALRVGRVVLVGFGMLSFLREALKGR